MQHLHHFAPRPPNLCKSMPTADDYEERDWQLRLPKYRTPRRRPADQDPTLNLKEQQ